jgi:hypothetical protein
MSIAELDAKKEKLANNILNEENESIIISLDDSYRKLKNESESVETVEERKKKITELWKIIDEFRISVPNYKFNREECYDRKVMYRKRHETNSCSHKARHTKFFNLGR